MSTTTPFHWLDLETVSRTVLATPPISTAVCQVRFNPSLALANPQTSVKFHEAIFDEYPDGRLEHGFQLEIGSNPSVMQAQAQSWRFADEEDNWAITLSSEVMAMETRKYTEFAEFRERFSRVLTALEDVVRPKLCSRIGLRYINEIRSPKEEWSRSFRPELLGMVGVQPFAAFAVQAIEQITLSHENDRVTFSHGVIPGGSIVSLRPGQEAPKGPFYLIDTDVYREFSGKGRFDVTQEAVIRHLDDFHVGASKLFWWAVTDDYVRGIGAP